ncbi:hypothetical protein GCM10009759_34760 [Kitasatospora saccharophila]|uniref:VCBS repeat protein n=1 Tax=Kitasatospora saccharophila TaxID=407973 RepID=A0ABN2WZF7_9ACTN
MSRSVPPRLLVGCATAALAAGLFAAPAAQAAPGPAVTAPTVVPGTYLDTGYTDGCNATGTPGWVGVSFPGPALYARTTAPAARFKVWDASGAKVIDGTADADPFGGVQVSAAGLPEGAGYTWQVWPQYRPGSGEPTATCRFGVDNTPPTALTAHSQDFPEHGGGRYAGQPGTFTFSAADTGSGLACFRYVLDDTPSTGGCAPGEGVVLPDADGTASVTLKPARWGSHVLLVQALDHAGNATQPLLYSFYAPQDPNPPKTLGDVDNDGVPDILLPDSQGNLLVIGGDTGGTTPSTVVPAYRAPANGSWTDLQVLHRGWSGGGAPADTIYVHAPGGDSLYQYVNQGALPLGRRSPALVDRTTDCVDTALTAVDCPPGTADSFADVRQLVALGPTDPARPTGITLLDVEQGDLWLQNDPSRFGAATRLTTGGAWDGYDLIAPGPDARGDLALWSREQATGVLRAHAVPKLADGHYDFSGLADPAAGTVLGTFPAADYPVLGSSGDLDGDGQPDLYAVTADRHLLAYHGTTAPKDRGALA